MRDLAACRTFVWQGLLIFFASGIGGCSRTEQPTASEPTPIQVIQLKQIYQMSFVPEDKPKFPKPKIMDELLQNERLYPQGVKALKTGDCVFIWSAYNSTTADTATTVISHVKNVPQEGGYVLLKDGTIKQMTADEFKASPKIK